MMAGKLWIAAGLALFATAVDAGEIRRPPAPSQPIDETAPSVIEATTEELTGWFEDLSSRDFAVRQRAGIHLRQAGKSAIPVIASRVDRTDELETIVRGVALLNELARSEDQPTRKAARAARQGLTKCSNCSVAQRAQTSLKPPVVADDDAGMRGWRRGKLPPGVICIRP